MFIKRCIFFLLICTLVSSCGTVEKLPDVPTENAASVFKPAEKSEKIDFVDSADLAAFEAQADPVYRLGAGDHIDVQVWGRPEISAKRIIGPDGRVSMPLAGSLKLADITREGAAEEISKAYFKFYKKPIVTVSVDLYTSNKVIVLGRVQNPGAITFDNPPTLLEALARAGSLPVIDKQATLTRCAVFRGRDRIIWVDLKRLLNRGESNYNIRLKPGDLIYIPDSFDTLVYVLGAVSKPGAYRLTPDMSLMDALLQAGGPNEDADMQEMGVYRPNKQAFQKTPMTALVTNQPKLNFGLEEGDVIYVPKSSMAEKGYVMRQLMPGLSFLTFGITASTSKN
jgi:polysaccharide export outer membrane protein